VPRSHSCERSYPHGHDAIESIRALATEKEIDMLRTLFPLAILISSSFAALQAQPSGTAIPRETLAPVLTPWEIAPPRTREAKQ